MNIAIDIDSTLHHYWDALAEAARRLFGVELSYEEQVTWEIATLAPDELSACIRDTHADARVLAAEPYPGAVEAVRRWRRDGHFIHVTSHRAAGAHDATERWLRRIGLPFDELYCSYDKVTRCAEIGVGVLIDDSPVNLLRAVDAGITGATLVHPWNRDVVERGAVVGADDWPDLEAKLAPFLA